MAALRRTNPAVYRTQQKLKLELEQISPEKRDFELAMSSIVPASVRSDQALAVPLSEESAPLLQHQLEHLHRHMRQHWPRLQLKSERLSAGLTLSGMFPRPSEQFKNANTIWRPRLLLTGETGNGQDQLARALLDSIDHLKFWF